MAMSWWLWLLCGIGLLLLELLTPGGFFILFFGVGAILVGLLAWSGLAGPDWVQWLLFGTFSAAALLIFRKPLLKKLRRTSTHEVDSMIGETAVALVDIAVQQIGKAELRGSAWTAQNTGNSAIAAGQRCRVEGMHGLTLYIRA
jgi:inner membrane protein